jgi:hypothetical protein
LVFSLSGFLFVWSLPASLPVAPNGDCDRRHIQFVTIRCHISAQIGKRASSNERARR